MQWCLGERRGLPAAYHGAAQVLLLAEVGIPPSEQEAMDPYLLAAVADLVTARNVADRQRLTERDNAG